MVVGSQVHFFVEITASGKSVSDPEECKIIIDDGFLIGGKFVHEAKDYGTEGSLEKKNRVEWRRCGDAEKNFELFNRFDKRWNPPMRW